ncbi:alpha-1,6-mannosyl-glycoprotein 2-beta-N-acetylglucosaminyltransferase-like [Dreissena polymorpha]|nr:alpha-1,6-mannosyl-glycoprotein 2-beta-N-acetylglucosaminyltransferase-like [Dreissena polymorpha]
MQIFFPLSIQLHPKSFPGDDPNDCPRDMRKEEAMKKKCNNAAFPDKYGHYREAKYCQIKHHWLWKLQHVYNKVHVMRGYKGKILLLEEDYYVAPDIIHIIQMVQSLRQKDWKDCKECKIIALGRYDEHHNFRVNADKVEVANWESSRLNRGIAFNRDLWEEIKMCAKEFCIFDDYNWDWTLQHLSSKCIPQMKVLQMEATRVFHMGDCGIHQKGKKCQPEKKKKIIEQLVGNNTDHLFPNTLSISSYASLPLQDPKPNGG